MSSSILISVLFIMNTHCMDSVYLVGLKCFLIILLCDVSGSAFPLASIHTFLLRVDPDEGFQLKHSIFALLICFFPNTASL